MDGAEVISFPNQVVRRCDNCEWAAFGTYGTFCTAFREEILNERVAEECETFEPIQLGGSHGNI